MLSEISQAVKDKYHMMSRISEPNQQNKQGKYNQRHWNKEQTDTNQRGSGEGIMGERRGRVIKGHV